MNQLLRYGYTMMLMLVCFSAAAQLPMPDSVCAGGTKRYSVNDATVPSTYTWKINGITQSSTLHRLFVTWNNPGVYTITVTEHGVNGCDGQPQQGVVYVFDNPVAHAGRDSVYCFEALPKLNGSGGNAYEWNPATYLSNPNIANPTVNVTAAGIYTYWLNVVNAEGCRSLIADTVKITVLPKARIFAGNDTSIAVNQPLQLNAVDIDQLGFTNYTWTPSFGLSNPAIPNPVSVLSADQTYTVRATTANGCKAIDDISIKVFALADIYVPNAFTPNGDGNNDLLRPILIGMKELKYFAVYNRYGELVYKTSVQKAGWNGVYKGQPQNTAAFVWMAEAVDFKGNTVFRKGMATLIR